MTSLSAHLPLCPGEGDSNEAVAAEIHGCDSGLAAAGAIPHAEATLAIARGGAAPYLARVLRVIARILGVDGALLVRIGGDNVELVLSCGIPLRALADQALCRFDRDLVQSGGQVADADKTEGLANHPLMAAAPHWRSLTVVPLGRRVAGLELRLVCGSSSPRPPAIATLSSELVRDVMRVLQEQLALVEDVALATEHAPEPAASPGIGSGIPHSSVLGQFLLDTLVVRHRLRSAKELSTYALRTWRKPLKAAQLSALHALAPMGDEQLETQISEELAGWVEQTFGPKRFTAVVPVRGERTDVSGMTGWSDRVAERLGVRLASQGGEIGTEIGATSARRGDPDILLIDVISGSGARLEQAARRLRSKGGCITAVSWVADD